MKKAKIIIITAIVLALSLSVRCACCYFFFPINPAISKKITMASQINVGILWKYHHNISEIRVSEIADEDLSFSDRILFWRLFSKLEPNENKLNLGGDPLFQFKIILPPNDGGFERCVRIYTGRVCPNGYCDAYSIYCDGSYKSEPQGFKFKISQKELDRLSAKYYKKGRLLRIEKQKDKMTSEQYSEAIEKIKNS